MMQLPIATKSPGGGALIILTTQPRAFDYAAISSRHAKCFCGIIVQTGLHTEYSRLT
jgi:hypothetical protein